ncbi:MAG: ABC transporter ATP-binding protein [Pseudonocardiales bacterium]
MAASPPRLVDGVVVLLRLARPARGHLGAAVALAVLATVLEVAPFYLVYRALAALLTGTADRAGLALLGGLAVLAVLARHVLWGWAMYLSHRAAYEVLYHLRLRVAERLRTVPLGYLTRRRAGEFQALLCDDGDRIELFLAHAVPELASAAAAWVLVTVWLVTVDWRMLAVTAAVVAIAFGLLALALRDASARMNEVSLAGRRVNGALVECLTALATLKLDDPEGRALADAETAIEDYRRAETAWARRFLPLGTAFTVLVAGGVLLIIPVGYLLVARGGLAPLDFLLFLVLGLGYSLPLLRFYQLGMRMALLTSAGGVVAEVLAAPAMSDSGREVALSGCDVEFDQVRFAYQGTEVLRGVSFVAPAGRVTALVGASGAGKSTAVRLLARFFDVDAGAVRIGGVDVREMAVRQLTATVSVVFQESFLVRDTLLANLRLGRPDAPEAALRDAVSAAQLTEVLDRLPDGWDTLVGERGATLSGGERQRVTIARTVLKDAPVVVLDEAGAYADPDSEAAVQRALAALVPGRTVIVIAHRLRTVRHADQIVVLDRGQVAEQGTHETLIRADGVYRRLWDSMADAGVQ